MPDISTRIDAMTRYVRQYIYMAQVRGVTPSNPVNFVFTPDSTQVNDQYRMIVSFTEPSFSDIPYNVLWLDCNPGSPSYQRVLLRISHISDGTYRSAWKVLNLYEELYKSPQIYRFVVEHASDLGIDIGELSVPRANTKAMGTVLLDPENPDSPTSGAVVVSDSDGRMTNARTPKDHTHDDYPRTMIRLNSSAYVEVTSSNQPEDGYVLAITSSDPNDRDRFVGEWVKPSQDNVEWTTPRLLGLSIRVPGNANFMQDNASLDLIAVAEFETDVITDPQGVVWSIEDNSYGITIHPGTGVVTAPDLPNDVTIIVTAKLRDPVFGHWVEATLPLTIKDVYVSDDLVSRLEISGPIQLHHKQRGVYSVLAVYSSGKSIVVSPSTFTSDNGLLALSGQTGVGGNTPTNVLTGLTATFTPEGQEELIARLAVTILAKVPSSFAIAGPASVDELTKVDYLCKLTWSNGDVTDVTPSEFTAAPPYHTEIDVLKLTAKEVSENTPIVLSAKYTHNGKVLSDSMDVLIRDVVVIPVPVSFEIKGATVIREETSATYTFEVTYDTGAKKTVTLPSGAFTSNHAKAVVSGSRVTAGQVDASLSVLLSASYTEDGVTVRDTHPVTIENYVAPVVLSSLEILGKTSIPEHTREVFTVAAHYSNGSTGLVDPSAFVIKSGGEYATLAGMALTGKEVTATSRVTLEATYTEDGVTKKDTHVVSVTDVYVPPELTGLMIEGAAQITEGGSQGYIVKALYNGGGKEAVTPKTFVASNPDVTISGLTASAPLVDTNTKFTLTATYEENGTTRTATKEVTIIDVPRISSIRISGATTLDEAGATEDYTVLSVYSNGSTEEVTPKTFTLKSGSAYATLSGQTLTSKSVDADRPVVLAATYTADGQTFNADLTVTIENAPATITGFRIRGPESANEQTTVQLTSHHLYSDGTETNPTTTWRVLGGPATINDSGLVTINKVTAPTTVRIQAKDLVERQATHTINVANNIIPPMDRLTIKGTTEVDSDTHATYTCTATDIDGFETDVTQSVVWSISKNAGLANVTIVRGRLVVPAVTADANIEIKAALSGKNDVHAVKIKAPASGGPRYGVVYKITNVADFNQEFMDKLTNPMTMSGEQFITIPAGSTTMANNCFCYTMWPKSLGYGYFRDFTSGSYGFAGSFDGAMEMDDFNFTEPALVTIGGEEYYIYRQDFPFEAYVYRYSILYGSKSPMSGIA